MAGGDRMESIDEIMNGTNLMSCMYRKGVRVKLSKKGGIDVHCPLFEEGGGCKAFQKMKISEVCSIYDEYQRKFSRLHK